MKQNVWLIYLTIISIISFSTNSVAVETFESQSPYTIEVPIENQTAIERQNALVKACYQLLSVRGISKTDLLPNTKNFCDQPDLYVKQFSYQKDTQGRSILRVSFHESMVDQLLPKQIKQMSSAQHQAMTVVWLIVEQNQTLKTVGGEGQPEIVKYIENWAVKNNIKLIIPSWDLTDLKEINANDIMAFDLDVLLKASKRYEADRLVIGVLQEQQGVWHARWLLSSSNGSQFKKTENKSWQPILSDILTSFLLVKGSPDSAGLQRSMDQSTVLLSIDNIGQAERYSKVMAYLQTLVPASNIDLKEVSDSRALFQLQLKSKTEFLEKIAADHIILPDNHQVKLMTTENEILTYMLP